MLLKTYPSFEGWGAKLINVDDGRLLWDAKLKGFWGFGWEEKLAGFWLPCWDWKLLKLVGFWFPCWDWKLLKPVGIWLTGSDEKLLNLLGFWFCVGNLPGFWFPWLFGKLLKLLVFWFWAEKLLGLKASCCDGENPGENEDGFTPVLGGEDLKLPEDVWSSWGKPEVCPLKN